MEFPIATNAKKVVNPTMHQDSVCKSIIGKILKSVIINIDFGSCKLLHSSHRLLGQANKQPLSNFELWPPGKYKQLSGLRPDPSCS